MSFLRWLRDFDSARRLSIHRQQRPSRAATYRPWVEALEDRLTPSFVWGGYDTTAPAGAEWAPPLPILADFTSDGILDRFTNVYGGVAVEPGRGDGTFDDAISTLVMGGEPAVDDFNGDGQLDIFTAAAGFDAGGYVTLYLGRGDGTFVYSNGDGYSLNVTPSALATGDFNHDGLRDLAVAGTDWYLFQEAVEVLLNYGDWSPLPVTLRIRDQTITEGDAGVIAATFTVMLPATSTQTVTVSFTTRSGSGTATAGSDFQPTSGTLIFNPGETSKTIIVPIMGDRLGEPNETFLVSLSNPTNATIDDGDGWGTILDNEPRINITDVSKVEGQKGQTTLFTFTVTLSASYDQPVTMSYRTVNAAASTSGNDYVSKSGTLTFAPGETSKTITIEVKGDSKREANETFYLELFALSNNAQFTKNRGTGTILNDD